MGSSCLSPKETSDTLIQSSIKKASHTTVKRMLLSFMAGAYIALGGQGFLVAYESPFIRAAVFPVGLMLIVLAGGELFTGNCLMTFGLIQKEITLKSYVKVLVQVFCGNLLGALAVAALLYFGGAYNNPVLAETVVNVAKAKISLSFVQVLSKGILCNILVSLGVWVSTTAKDATGKMLGCWFPVMLFVFCGYEHVVANMFFLPMGAILDSSVTLTQIVGNLIPSAIGNYIGGGIIVPVIYHQVYYR
ncbi:MAG TPA: FdhC protein [Clostridiales bacterium]|nr:FdhC protein [Clostridiales bacterium]